MDSLSNRSVWHSFSSTLNRRSSSSWVSLKWACLSEVSRLINIPSFCPGLVSPSRRHKHKKHSFSSTLNRRSLSSWVSLKWNIIVSLKGHCVRAVSPGSLQLWFVGFGRGCARPPRPLLWRWRMSGQGRMGVSPGSFLLRSEGFTWGCAGARDRPGPVCGGIGCLGARSRPDLCYCGQLASVGLRGCVGPPGSRWRGSQSGPGCGARSSPYLCLIVWWASDGPAPPRSLAGFFVVAVGGVRVGLRVREDSSLLLLLAYILLD